MIMKFPDTYDYNFIYKHKFHFADLYLMFKSSGQPPGSLRSAHTAQFYYIDPYMNSAATGGKPGS